MLVAKKVNICSMKSCVIFVFINFTIIQRELQYMRSDKEIIVQSSLLLHRIFDNIMRNIRFFLSLQVAGQSLMIT